MLAGRGVVDGVDAAFDQLIEDRDGVGEAIGDDEASAAGAGEFEDVEALSDVGSGEPECEFIERGVVLGGDVGE